AAVGVVQSLYDATLLNPSNYGGIGRAAGLMLDGNVFGVVTALCGAAAVVVGLREGGQRQAAVAASAACLRLAATLAANCSGVISISHGMWPLLRIWTG